MRIASGVAEESVRVVEISTVCSGESCGNDRMNSGRPNNPWRFRSGVMKPSSRTLRRSGAVAAFGAAALGVTILSALAYRETVTDSVPSADMLSSLRPGSIRGLSTSVHDGEGLRLRVSADTVELSQPRFLGPFRIGFLRSLEVRNANVEIFDVGEGSAEVAEKGEMHLGEVAASLVPEGSLRSVGHVTVGPIQLVRHVAGKVALSLDAARCETTLRGAEIACYRGVLREGGESRWFGEARYDGRRWEVVRGGSR